MKKVTLEIREQIATLHSAGTKVDEIMQQLNLSRSFVFAELQRRGLIAASKQHVFKDEALRLYTDGLTIQEVADKLGSSNGTIGRIVATAEIGRPKAGRPNPGVAAARRKSITVDGLKLCTVCEEYKPPEQFPPSKVSLDGRRPQCNVCHNRIANDWRVNTPAGQAYSSKKAKERYENVKCATPPWADITAIEMVYLEARRLTRATSEAYTVDHIVPLVGTVVDELGERPVCGLHVAANLRVMSRTLNARKSNRLIHKEY